MNSSDESNSGIEDFNQLDSKYIKKSVTPHNLQEYLFGDNLEEEPKGLPSDSEGEFSNEEMGEGEEDGERVLREEAEKSEIEEEKEEQKDSHEEAGREEGRERKDSEKADDKQPLEESPHRMAEND